MTKKDEAAELVSQRANDFQMVLSNMIHTLTTSPWPITIASFRLTPHIGRLAAKCLIPSTSERAPESRQTIPTVQYCINWRHRLRHRGG